MATRTDWPWLLVFVSGVIFLPAPVAAHQLPSMTQRFPSAIDVIQGSTLAALFLGLAVITYRWWSRP